MTDRDVAFEHRAPVSTPWAIVAARLGYPNRILLLPRNRSFAQEITRSERRREKSRSCVTKASALIAIALAACTASGSFGRYVTVFRPSTRPLRGRLEARGRGGKRPCLRATWRAA